jgi:hypothetical protein
MTASGGFLEGLVLRVPPNADAAVSIVTSRPSADSDHRQLWGRQNPRRKELDARNRVDVAPRDPGSRQ